MWEHMLVKESLQREKHIQEALNTASAQGWELTGVATMGMTVLLFFKRPKRG